MNEKSIREILFFEEHFLNFYNNLRPQVKKKFNWTLQLISTVERIPEKYFKHLTGTDGLYEIRVEVGSNIFRVFSFFDKGQLIILVNGFQKKSQKTPKKEIQLALKLKKQYFDGKD
ncbi:type II toxin-antitoxin system RelE/ParE family toxin [Jiulongibacter sp. NS-SX5]|uniref:type II toxin-antitoxin system RelE/ParE family toxin n=1 Tax=Jiulongibacter sp. NS-SX5 TaxID=3463854 RepID=UPI004058E5FA